MNSEFSLNPLSSQPMRMMGRNNVLDEQKDLEIPSNDILYDLHKQHMGYVLDEDKKYKPYSLLSSMVDDNDVSDSMIEEYYIRKHSNDDNFHARLCALEASRIQIMIVLNELMRRSDQDRAVRANIVAGTPGLLEWMATVSHEPFIPFVPTPLPVIGSDSIILEEYYIQKHTYDDNRHARLCALEASTIHIVTVLNELMRRSDQDRAARANIGVVAGTPAGLSEWIAAISHEPFVPFVPIPLPVIGSDYGGSVKKIRAEIRANREKYRSSYREDRRKEKEELEARPRMLPVGGVGEEKGMVPGMMTAPPSTLELLPTELRTPACLAVAEVSTQSSTAVNIFEFNFDNNRCLPIPNALLLSLEERPELYPEEIRRSAEAVRHPATRRKRSLSAPAGGQALILEGNQVPCCVSANFDFSSPDTPRKKCQKTSR